MLKQHGTSGLGLSDCKGEKSDKHRRKITPRVNQICLPHLLSRTAVACHLFCIFVQKRQRKSWLIHFSNGYSISYTDWKFWMIKGVWQTFNLLLEFWDVRNCSGCSDTEKKCSSFMSKISRKHQALWSFFFRDWCWFCLPMHILI